MKQSALDRLKFGLDNAMRGVERVLSQFGVSHWKATLIVRNVTPDKPGEWVLLTMDDEIGNPLHEMLRSRETTSPTPEPTE